MRKAFPFAYRSRQSNISISTEQHNSSIIVAYTHTKHIQFIQYAHCVRNSGGDINSCVFMCMEGCLKTYNTTHQKSRTTQCSQTNTKAYTRNIEDPPQCTQRELNIRTYTHFVQQSHIVNGFRQKQPKQGDKRPANLDFVILLAKTFTANK